MLATQLSTLGQIILDLTEGLGRFTCFCWSTLKWLFLGDRWANRFSLLTPQLYAIGTRSIPVVAIVGAFVGMVLAVEAYDQFAAIGQETRLGGIINISVVRQIGPVLSAVMIAGRVGGAVSAELGTMRVTEQLDALRVMGADPVNYLVVPRILACLIMVPILTVFSNLLGVFGGYLVTVRGFGVNASDYWEFSARFVESYDVFSGLIKSLLFGLAIGAISCYKGFHCRSGAAGVGRAATDSFVTSFIVIVILNLFLASFLKDLYSILFGYETVSAFS
jgi:phospholipid/cholesterol/gamma-HCH transport system permease protein